MHYGEYLVQEKILSAHHILKALQEQRRRRKYLPLLLVEIGAMEDFRALRLATIADYNQQDFLEVLDSEGIISQEQYEMIKEAWTKSGPPLGHLLVEMGYMDEQTRIDSLEQFAHFIGMEGFQNNMTTSEVMARF